MNGYAAKLLQEWEGQGSPDQPPRMAVRFCPLPSASVRFPENPQQNGPVRSIRFVRKGGSEIAQTPPADPLANDIMLMASFYQATAQELAFMIEQARQDPDAWRQVIARSKAMWGWDKGEGIIHPFLPWADDQRPCTACTNLRDGRCLAAQGGALRHLGVNYAPADPDRPRRCIGYSPRLADIDRRPGRERWPGLAPWQENIQSTEVEDHE